MQFAQCANGDITVTKDNAEEAQKCQWIGELEAFKRFARFGDQTQSAAHIKPLHWYVASRLVLEGGFSPDEITPHPPFAVQKKGKRLRLIYDPKMAEGGEATVLGGLKTKNVDVVVCKQGIGPVLAISCKGMTGALRNLTNRMEETIGECTNLHITYPAMVFGYLFMVRGNRMAETNASATQIAGASPVIQLGMNDIAIRKGGEPVEGLIRFHSALQDLTGRRGIRNDVSRYEAVCLAMVEMESDRLGTISPSFPAQDSPLRFEQFFKSLFLRYDERYVYSAPLLKGLTSRIEWARDSPILADKRSSKLSYEVRVAFEEKIED